MSITSVVVVPDTDSVAWVPDGIVPENTPRDELVTVRFSRSLKVTVHVTSYCPVAGLQTPTPETLARHAKAEPARGPVTKPSTRMTVASNFFIIPFSSFNVPIRTCGSGSLDACTSDAAPTSRAAPPPAAVLSRGR